MPTQKTLEIPSELRPLFASVKDDCTLVLHDLISQPEFKEPADLALKDDSQQPPRWWTFLIKVWNIIKTYLVADPNHCHGNGYVSRDCRADGKRNAGILSIANIWTIGTSFSFFIFITGGLLGGALALVPALIVLHFSNKVGEGYATSNSRKASYAKRMAIFFIAINAVTTLIAGPGADMLLNRDVLVQQHAAQIVEETIIADLKNRQAEARQLATKHQALQLQCDQAREEISQLPQGSTERIDKYRQHLGPYDQKDWIGEPDEVLPTCPLAKRYAVRAKDAQQKADQDVASTRAALSKMGAQVYLRDKQPLLYAVYFAPQGDPKSGVAIAAIAFSSFVKRVVTGDFASLVVQMFSSAVSAITSLAAISALGSYAQREDTKDSHDADIPKYRDHLLTTLRESIQALPVIDAES